MHTAAGWWVAVHGGAWARQPVVELWSSDSGGLYAEMASLLKRDTADVPLDWVLAEGAGADASSLPALVVTLGAKAWREAALRAQQSPAWSQVPVLAALLPQSAQRLTSHALPKGSSAVWLDQPVERMVELLRQALPQRRRVGVLLGAESLAAEPALVRAAAARGLELVRGVVRSPADELYPALRTVLQRADVLLALPDPQLFGADALQNILIASYRQRVPMLSYSAAHVRAGATLALHTPMEQVSLQVAAALRAFASGRGLPAPQAAEGFAVAVNTQVARSLGLDMRSASELEAAVRRQEGRT